MKELIVKSKKNKEVIDVTERIEELLPDFDGICTVFVLHTTAAVTTADLDPGTDEDMLRAYEEMLPDLDYKHPHDPSHVKDHINASLIDPCVSVPFRKGRLQLGVWQRVVLFEFNGPRERKAVLKFFKEEG
jgi:secondary thiamine-phosphate synthase enzyme